MAIIGKRGAEEKRLIRSEWDLVPVMHTHLLNGHLLTCCCGEDVRGRYYRFNASHRRTGRIDVLFAGEHCARELLRISPEMEALPFFNPLTAPRPRVVRRGVNQGGAVPGMDPFNTELYAVIHLVLMCWGRPPTSEGPLSKILEEIRRAPTQARPAWTAKSVNTIVGKGGRALPEMLAALPPQEPPLRDFDFPLLHRALEQAGVTEVWL